MSQSVPLRSTVWMTGTRVVVPSGVRVVSWVTMREVFDGVAWAAMFWMIGVYADDVGVRTGVGVGELLVADRRRVGIVAVGGGVVVGRFGSVTEPGGVLPLGSWR